MERTDESSETPRAASWHDGISNPTTGNGNSASPTRPHTLTTKESPPAKRKKQEKERSRVSRACDRCKKKKTRCNGRCPCPLCVRAGFICEFTASYTRGRLPPVMIDADALAAVNGSSTTPTTASITHTTSGNSSTSPFQVPKIPLQNTESLNSSHGRMPDGFPGTETLDAANEDVARDSLSRSSPEPTETDRQGHYIGPSSGVSFLLRIQKKLHENRSLSHNSSIFTFGDAPLPDHDDTFFVLPPKADAIRLVERYFDFAAPTHRFLHRPTIENLLDEFFETRGEMLHKEDAAAKKALLLMIFAQAQAYMEPATAGGDNSAQYYFAAERQLAKERGACTLSSVQARLVECYYLLAQSRINQCWSLFGTTAHLALAIGLNRSRRGDSSGKVDYLELECQRRTFWSAYVLDKFLSAALGRPMTLRDPDIDQELPTVINDDDLFSHTMKPTPPTTPSIMRAPVEHIRLSRIVSSVLRDLYPIRPPSMPLRIELAAKYSTQLVEWRSRLSRFLDAEGIDSSLLLPLYQRQRNVLNLAYYHTMLLVHRPFLLSNFASLSNIGARPGQVSNIDTSENITQCLDAALSIVRIVDEIFQSSQIFRAFWFTQYYAFCAVVVIYIYRIQQQHSVDSGKSEEYFAAGQRCQAQLSSLTDTDCLSKRYCLVLEELRLEAARQTTGSPATLRPDVAPMNMDTQNTRPSEPLPNGTPSSSLAVPVPTASNADPNPSTFQSTFYSGAIPPTPESAVFTSTWMGSDGFMEDLTTWGQFDSFVTAGIGVLDGVGTGLGR